MGVSTKMSSFPPIPSPWAWPAAPGPGSVWEAACLSAEPRRQRRRANPCTHSKGSSRILPALGPAPLHGVFFSACLWWWLTRDLEFFPRQAGDAMGPSLHISVSPAGSIWIAHTAQRAGASKQVVEGNLLPEMEKSCSQLSMSLFITFILKLLLI